MKQLTCGFIGLGLIGGSIARALREKLPESRIIAYDINENSLQLALSEGIADVVTNTIDRRFADCDYIFLCAPVRKNDENLRTVSKILSPNCILTDVGSVKSEIHRAVKEAGLEKQFIGGHPMAGSERVGFVNSKAILLENAYYILTPTDQVPPQKTIEFRQLVTLLGALPLVLDCTRHDFATAAISHLPHVVAASLVNLVQANDSEDGLLRMIAAGGFKDITRIASSSAAMWQQICLSNPENITNLLSIYIRSLESFREKIESADEKALYELFDSARVYRDSFIDASSGPIKREYSVHVDIADEPGALAAITALLATHGISIKNLGILHNRETEGGVLHLEFHDEVSLTDAKKLLNDKGYGFGF